MGGKKRWAGLILLLLVPGLAVISACNEQDCYPVPDDEFLQLNQEGVMEEIRVDYGCALLNTQPLGVFSWSEEEGVHLNECHLVWEVVKYMIGVSVRPDFENFASSCSPLSTSSYSLKTEGVEEWSSIEKKWNNLQASWSKLESQNEALEDSIQEFNKFKSEDLRGCGKAVQAFAGEVMKQGKKLALKEVKEWAERSDDE